MSVIGDGRVDKPAIVFVALQTRTSANGGIASLGEILAGLKHYRPIVLTNRESAIVGKWRAAGIEVVVVAEHASLGVRRAPLRAVATYWRYHRSILNLLARTGARVLHANDPLAYQLSYTAVRQSRTARMVFSIRDTLDPRRIVPRRRFRWIFGTAAHSFFLSHDMRERWRTVSPIPESLSSVTGSVVDFSRFEASPPPAGGTKIILLLGIISPKKGQLHFLTHAAPRLLAAGYEIHLCGDDDPDASDYVRACRAVADSLARPVQFLGYRRDVPELMRAASIVCVASRYEGLMRSMIEAMAACRPVVSTDVCSAQEMLRKPGCEAGLVVPIDYRNEMADAIIRLCNDAKLASELGENGSRIARQLFTAQQVVAVHEQVYDRLELDRARS